jgi:hypothetical protein
MDLPTAGKRKFGSLKNWERQLITMPEFTRKEQRDGMIRESR